MIHSLQDPCPDESRSIGTQCAGPPRQVQVLGEGESIDQSFLSGRGKNPIKLSLLGSPPGMVISAQLVGVVPSTPRPTQSVARPAVGRTST